MSLPESSSPAEDSRDAPLAFSRATGAVHQVFGAILALGTGCWGFVYIFLEVPVTPAEPGRPLVVVTVDSPAERLWGMAAFWLTFAAGLASAAVGLGIQSDRAAAARAGMVLSGAAGLFFAVYLVAAIVYFPGIVRIAIGAVMAAAWTVMFLLDGHSAELLRRHGPVTAADSEWTPGDEDDLRRSASPRPPDRTSP